MSTTIAGVDTDAIGDPEIWNTMRGLRVRSVLGPVVHHYRDDVTGLPELAAGRLLGEDDAHAIAELSDAVTPQEWAAAGFAEGPTVRFGIFDGDRIMAAANLTSGPDVATDIGIVVRSDARGKGYGVQVAATAARHAIEAHGIARFRVLATSTSTLAIAQTLGFEPYGRNLTVYLA